MNTLRIIFMGTPEFAVPSLEILIKNKFDVVAVITAPDKPQGRGQQLTSSPVKQCAVAHGIPVLQPTNLKSATFLSELATFDANLQIVVAFRMLPEVVWTMPSLGTFNLHASLLPQYRGAAPINWAIINGEHETGVTTFFLKHEIDTGSIIYQEKETISADDDAGSLYEKLMKRGSELVLKTVKAIASGNYPSLPQVATREINHAPKIFKETCQIHWGQPALQVINFIRGLSPYPAAWTTIGDRTFKIYRASIVAYEKEAVSGEYATDNKNYLYLKSDDSWVSITEFQPDGKRRMNVRDYFLGNKI